ncbi:MAG: undecaprenyl-diphosphate phosphatase [Clostridia bacterium]|nr:undecaprenyl-diphosphate phosphatase [Clostridia bacterium]
MQWWQAIILGLTQGLTEFLPVSSSGHLAFLQSLFGISSDGSLFFDLILHLGTLVAVCIIFRKEILALFKKPFKTLLYLVVASIPAGVIGVLLEYFDVIDDYILGSPYLGYLLAIFFCITAGVLFATEIFAKRRKKIYPLGWRTALPMGFAQAVAILPGISRSGSTIAAGIFSGGDTEEVSHFSFLMSIPIILGGFLVELVKGLTDAENSFVTAFQTNPQYGWCVAIGFIISAVAGLFAIKVMLAAIKKANYKWFSVYLVLLAITCIVLQSTGFMG